MSESSTRRAKRQVETHEYLQMARRMIRAAGTRVGNDDVEYLSELVDLREYLNTAIVSAVAGLRKSGHTWQDIGDATGTTRQAAIMKWSRLV